MEVLSPKSEELVILGNKEGTFSKDRYHLELVLKKKILSNLFKSDSLLIEVEVQPLKFQNESATKTIKDWLKSFLTKMINDLLQSQIKTNPLKDQIKIKVNLFPIINLASHLLPRESLFRITLGFEVDSTHFFDLSIQLPESFVPNTELSNLKTNNMPILKLADPDEEIVVLYNKEQYDLILHLESTSEDALAKYIDRRIDNLRLLSAVITKIEEYEENEDDESIEKNKLEDLFLFDNTNSVEIKSTESPRVYSINFTLTPDFNLLQKEIIFSLELSLSTLAESDGPKICIPIILRPKAFQGVVSLDFGTTNSACIYWNPKRWPVLPERYLTDSQVKSLSKALESLFSKLQSNEEWKPLLEHLLINARNVFYSRYLDNIVIKNLDDIKKAMTVIEDNEIIERTVKIYTNWIANWAVYGYNQFSSAYPDLSKVLLELYFQFLDEVINVDIQNDVSIHRPKLEEKATGEISSSVRLDKLEKNSRESITDFAVDMYRSEIKMGQAIEDQMTSSQVNLIDELYEKAILDGDIVHNRFLTGIKRFIGTDNLAHFIDNRGTGIKDKYDPIAFLAIQQILSRVEKNDDIRGSIKSLVATYPVNLPQHRRKIFRSLIRRFGIRNIDIGFDEATSVALYYIWRELLTDSFTAFDGFLSRSQVEKHNKRISKEFYQNYLVYDMGGGTTDIALIEVKIEEKEVLPNARKDRDGRYFEIKPKILGLTGVENYGGDNVTLAIFRLLKTKLTYFALTHGKNLNKDNTAPKDFLESPDKVLAWLQEKQDNQEEEYEKIKDGLDFFVPTMFKHDPSKRSSFFKLWKEAEKAKIHLSTKLPKSQEYPDHYKVNDIELLHVMKDELINPSSNNLNITVSRNEMEGLINKKISTSFLKALNLSLDEVDGKTQVIYKVDKVILAGNSSKLRIVKEKVHRILASPFDLANTVLPPVFEHDDKKVIFDETDAKLAVARGACLPGYLQNISLKYTGENVTKHIKDGKNFLSFNVDNIRNHIPYTIIYLIGQAEQATIFRAGEELKPSDSFRSIPYARRKVWASEIGSLYCYKKDNLSLSGKLEKGTYIGTFPIKETRRKIDMNSNGDINSAFDLFLDFDSNRDLKCYLVEKKIVENFKTGHLIEQDSGKDIMLKPSSNGHFTWNDNLNISCALNIISDKGNDSVNMQRLDIATRNSIPLRNSQYYIYVNETLLWNFEVNSLKLPTTEFTAIEIDFKIENNLPVLSYAVSNPDFEKCVEVPYFFDEDMASYIPFNPFSGTE